MGRHIGRLIRDGHGIVFIQQTDGDGTRDDVFVALFVLDREREHVAFVKHGADCHPFAV